MKKTEACIWLSSADRATLESGSGRNTPQKVVWRARIVVLSADRSGVMAIARAIGKSKVTVSRWQERYLAKGIAGLRRDATRPGRKPPLSAETIEQVVHKTLHEKPVAGDPLEHPQDGRSQRPQLHQRAAHLEGARAQAASDEDLQAVERPAVRREGAGRRRPLPRPAGEGAGASRWTRRARSRRWIAPSPACR